MGSRRKTGVEGVRLPELSRRAVIAGTSVAVFGAAKPATALATPPALTAPDADSDDAAHPFRDDRAHHCEMMPPIRGVVVGGLI
jgi:hypothetical protein